MRQEAELDFWKKDYSKYSRSTYAKVRAGNLKRIREHWPEIDKLEGTGLDLGCGPCSIFEGSGLEMYAADPLMSEYAKFYKPPGEDVTYIEDFHKLDEGQIGFTNGFLDFIFCINVIDHTEHWEKLIQEIYRVLTVHGFLFLQVNFDWVLTKPEHVKLWNWEAVQKEVASHLFPVRQILEFDYENQRYSYWGKFQKA
jgi:SAM-dependent methyltransferase